MELKQEFFKIDKYYGGKQEWLYKSGYITKEKADRSCGVAAAANIIQYLSKENPEYNKLYSGNGKEDYVELMRELYIFLNPRFYGIPTIRKMKKSILDFAKSKGVDLKASSEIWILNKTYKDDFIKKAILEGHPVLLLTWNFPDLELKNHWVTITGWEEKEGEEFIIVSNWGYKRTYSYTKWINENSLFKGALYFQK